MQIKIASLNILMANGSSDSGRTSTLIKERNMEWVSSGHPIDTSIMDSLNKIRGMVSDSSKGTTAVFF